MVVSYWKKNKKMYNKDLDIYPHGLQFFPDSYKTQKVRNKVVNTQLSTIQFPREFYKSYKIYDRAADSFPFIFDLIPFLEL